MDVVVGAKDAVTMTVTGAKDTVAHTINGVVDKTKGAVQDSVEMTRSVVHGSINTVLGSRVVRLVSSGVDTALSRSETLVDQYLPLTEEEQGRVTFIRASFLFAWIMNNLEDLIMKKPGLANRIVLVHDLLSFETGLWLYTCFFYKLSFSFSTICFGMVAFPLQ